MSQTAFQTTEAHRLTLTARHPSRNLPLTANIPKFTRAPQATSLPIRPLPKTQKINKSPKTAQEKKKEKISNHQKKVLKARVARAEKERGPLPEPEDGEYDANGFWVEFPKKSSGEDGFGDGVRDGEHLRLRGGHGEDEGREGGFSQLPTEEDNDVAMQEALEHLQGMPSGQTFDDLFDLDKTPYYAPVDERRHVPAASTAPRDVPRDEAQPPKRRRLEAPETLNGIQLDISRDQYPTTPNINDTTRSRLRHPISAMRGSGMDYDPPLDDTHFENQNQEYIPMPESAQPRRATQEEEDDFEVGYPMLSPTEMDSSAIREPVSRSQTRRSNDRSRVYSLEPRYQRAFGYLPVGHTRPSSFAVSDTEAGTPTTPPIPPTLADPPQRLKTYAKGSKSAPTRTRVATSRNPAQRQGFKDMFSPEPEWEEEHLTAPSGKVDRSKKVGSTSWWPDTATPPALVDETSEEDEDDEDMEARVRHILGEVEVSERGQRVARGRKRNGPWPEGRDMGLFHEDTQDQAARPTELYRPVSERFHLVKEEQQTPLVQDTPPPEVEPRKRHNPRANHDRPVEHPVPQLVLGRQRSVAERLDDYTLKVNSRQSRRHAELPNNPVVQTNIKSTIIKPKKRKSRFDIPNLPSTVLKPIATLPAEEYKKQLKLRNPGDGFLNPVLIKAGRLGTRDVILKQHQSRIRNTGKKRGVKTQMPIVDEMGEPDPIVVSQSTQVPRGEQPGFAVRQMDRVRATTARYQRLRPKLPFTSQSPPPHRSTSDGGSNPRGHGYGMRFTARSPPRRHSGVSGPITPESEAETYQPPPRPALDVPGLIAPKVGFGTRYKKSPVGYADDSESTRTSVSRVQSTGKGEGFIRRRPGFQEPPPAEEGVLYGDEQTVGEGGNNGGSGTPIERDSRAGHLHQQEPLFLEHNEEIDGDHDHDDDRDLDSNASRHDPVTLPDSTALITPNTGLSGAQLCNNLLQAAVKLPLPLKTAKSRWQEKREEMARRIKEREETGTPFGEQGGVRLTDKVHELGPLFDDTEDEDEVEFRPTMSQLKRRKEFGFGFGSNDQASLTWGTQVNNEELDQTSTHPPTQAPQVLTTQLSSFNPDQGPPARNPGRSGRTPATPPTAITTNTAAVATNTIGTTQLKKAPITSRHFLPPKVIPKAAGVTRAASATKRSGPR